jgi:hypothetical protein
MQSSCCQTMATDRHSLQVHRSLGSHPPEETTETYTKCTADKYSTRRCNSHCHIRCMAVAAAGGNGCVDYDHVDYEYVVSVCALILHSYHLMVVVAHVSLISRRSHMRQPFPNLQPQINNKRIKKVFSLYDFWIHLLLQCSYIADTTISGGIGMKRIHYICPLSNPKSTQPNPFRYWFYFA